MSGAICRDQHGRSRNPGGAKGFIAASKPTGKGIDKGAPAAMSVYSRGQDGKRGTLQPMRGSVVIVG